ncbi:hypothetical protein HZY88_05310 [Aerococcaceae bacterium DSM 111176]|nr:hypothetical protein [Aerococcaceae bacterium DSM 111176]
MTKIKPNLEQDAINDDEIDEAIQQSEAEMNEGGELKDAKSALQELKEKHFG